MHSYSTSLSEPAAQGVSREHDSTPLPVVRRSDSLRILLLVAAVTLLAFALRLFSLGTKSLWIDEIWSIATARLTWAGFGLTLLNQDPNMSLYHVLLHYWLFFAGDETAIRVLSVLFGAGTVPLLYALGTRLSSRFVGLCSCLLFSLNSFHVQWSQETRSYSLLVLLVTASSLEFLTALDRPGKRPCSLYVFLSTLAVYVHLFALLIIAAHAVSLCFARKSGSSRGNALVSMAAIGLCSLPLLSLFYLRSRDPFIPVNWIQAVGIHDVIDVFHRLSGRAEIPGVTGGRILMVLVCIACTAALVRRPPTSPTPSSPIGSWSTTFLLLWLLLPASLLFLISFRQPILLARYILPSLPALTTLVALGIQVVPRSAWRLAALLLFCAMNSAQLFEYYSYRAHQQGWREAASHILNELEPGDAAIFCVAPGHLLFDYYAELRSFPPGRMPEILYPYHADPGNPRSLAYLPAIDQGSLELRIRNHERVWLALYHDRWPAVAPQSDRLRWQLTQRMSPMATERYGDVTIVLYSKEPAPVAHEQRGAH